MRGRLLAAALAGLLLLGSGCRTAPVSRPRPGDRQALDLWRRARAAWRRGAGEVEPLLAAAIARDFQLVPAHLLYQELRLGRREEGALIAEYREHCRRRPHCAATRFLYGRLLGDPDRVRRELEAARALDPASPWPGLGLAELARRAGAAGEALEHLRAALALAPDEPLLQLKLAEILAGQRRWRLARQALERVLDLDPGEARASRHLALIHRLHGEPETALSLLLAGLWHQPHHRGLARELRDIFREFPRLSAGENAGAALAAILANCPESRPVRGTLAWLCRRAGDRAGAEREYSRLEGSEEPDLINDRRRLHFSAGRYRAGLAAWSEKLPPGLLFAPGNLLAPRFRLLWQRAARAEDEPAPENLRRLGQALSDVGWLEEAAAVWTRAAAAGDGPAGELAAALDAERRQLAAARQALLAGYRDCARDGAWLTLEEVLALVAGSRAELLAGLQLRAEPFIGRQTLSRLTDPSPLVRHWRRHGCYFLAGEPPGDTAQALLVPAVAWFAPGERSLCGQPVTSEFIVGDTPLLPSYPDYRDRLVEGLTVHGHFAVNLDSVYLHAGYFARALRGPLPAPAPADPGETDPAAFAWQDQLVVRLVRSAFAGEEPPGRPELIGAVLDGVIRHELWHRVDAHRHLPLLSHPGRNLGLLVQSGFSATAVQAWLEARAQLAALASADRPELELANLAGFLPHRDGALPHSRGYWRVMRELVDLIARAPADFPELDPAENILRQLHRLAPDQLRRLAGELVRRRGMERAAAEY